MKVDSYMPYTGILKNNIVFSNNGYHFTFFENNFNYKDRESPILINPSDEFIHGQTHNGPYIAMNIGKNSIEFNGHMIVNVPVYIISKSHVTSFDGITFKGGSLNQLYRSQSLNIIDNETSKNNFLSFSLDDDSIHYNFKIDKECSCNIAVGTHLSFMASSIGNNINYQDIQLTIDFQKPQTLSSIIKHYSVIKNLLSFMTFRNSVSVDEIILKQREHMDNDYSLTYLNNVATVFIQEDLVSNICWKNIKFNDLGDSLPKLLTLFYNNDFSLGFYPDNNESLYEMNDSKIRNICTALEYELKYTELNIEESQKLTTLIEEIKNIVKQHKNSENKLDDNTYNMIFSSMRNWDKPFTDKLYNLCEQYMVQLSILMQERGIHKKIDKSYLHEFIKYRNDITHGSRRTINNDIAGLAHILSGLVYCCLLKRVGITDDKLSRLCRYNILK